MTHGITYSNNKSEIRVNNIGFRQNTGILIYIIMLSALRRQNHAIKHSIIEHGYFGLIIFL